MFKYFILFSSTRKKTEEIKLLARYYQDVRTHYLHNTVMKTKKAYLQYEQWNESFMILNTKLRLNSITTLYLANNENKTSYS